MKLRKLLHIIGIDIVYMKTDSEYQKVLGEIKEKHIKELVELERTLLFGKKGEE